MGRTGLEHQTHNGEALATKIKDLEKLVNELRTVQPQGSDAIRIVRDIQSDVLTTVGVNVIFTVTLQFIANVGETKPVFCQPEVTLYEDLVDPANVIGGSNTRYDHWHIWSRVDASSSTSTRIVYKVTAQNKDTVSHGLIIRPVGRWIVTK